MNPDYRAEAHLEIVRALQGAFLDEVGTTPPPRNGRAPQAAKPVDHAVRGVARTANGPALLVHHLEHRHAARKWGARHADGEFDLLDIGAPCILPNRKAHWWGWKTPAYGELIGGKTFYRRDDPSIGGASGGTGTIVAVDTGGHPTVVANLHCLAPMHGTGADPDHHVLWEAEWKAPFATTDRWMQITTHPKHANLWDIGTARVHPDYEGDIRVGEILDIGRVTGTTRFRLGEMGLMNGATTGRRDKRVIATDVTSLIGYDWTNPDTGEKVEGDFALTDLVTFDGTPTSPASQPGDSGSPAAVRRGADLLLGAVVFAGDDKRGRGFGFQADDSFKAFGLTFG